MPVLSSLFLPSLSAFNLFLHSFPLFLLTVTPVGLPASAPLNSSSRGAPSKDVTPTLSYSSFPTRPLFLLALCHILPFSLFYYFPFSPSPFLLLIFISSFFIWNSSFIPACVNVRMGSCCTVFGSVCSVQEVSLEMMECGRQWNSVYLMVTVLHYMQIPHQPLLHKQWSVGAAEEEKIISI